MVDLLHMVLVIAFVGVTGSLLALTVIRRLRVRRVVLSWRSVSPARLPMWPILFMGIVAVLNVYAANAMPGNSSDVFAGYLFGAVLWLASSLLGGTVFVTELGIIRDTSRADESIAWVQVSDWFEAGRGSVFVFIYEASDGTHRRLELPVPLEHVESLRRYLRFRFEEPVVLPVARSVGRTALEG